MSHLGKGTIGNENFFLPGFARLNRNFVVIFCCEVSRLEGRRAVPKRWGKARRECRQLAWETQSSCCAVVPAVRVSFLSHPSMKFLAKRDIFGEAVSCSVKPELEQFLGCTRCLPDPQPTHGASPWCQGPSWDHVCSACLGMGEQTVPGAVLRRPGRFISSCSFPSVFT